MASKTVLSKAINILFMAYPRAVLREGTLDVYSEFLSDIPDDVLLQAISEQTTTSEYFPPIANIRKAAALIQSGLGVAPNGAMAWAEVCDEMRKGEAKQPKFSHPLIDQVVHDMNWYNLRTSDNMVADRARFIEAYDGLLARAIKQFTTPPSVRALTERNNREFSQSFLPPGSKES